MAAALIRRRFGRRMDGDQIHHQPDLLPPLGAILCDRCRMGPQQVLRNLGGFRPIASARRVVARDVAVVHRDPRFVERRPHRHAVAQRAKHQSGILDEPLRRVGVSPATALFERGRQVPVIERHAWRDAVLQECVDEPRIEVEPLEDLDGRCPRAAREPRPC